MKYNDSAMRVPVFVRCRSTRIIFLAFFGIFLFILFINGNIFSSIRHDPTALRAELLHMGEQYVRALADQQGNVQDGPYSGIKTHYDLKKTLAVLLESILNRLNRLEKLYGAVNNSVLQSKLDENVINAHDLLAGVQEQCDLVANWQLTYPHCEEKVKWMEAFWKSDPCYANYGVDGSRCSYIIYLSEVETYCPRYPWRPPADPSNVRQQLLAVARFDLQGLFDLMKDNPTNFQWIKMRIERMWPRWVAAHRALEDKQNWTLVGRPKKRALLHLGFLTKESGFKFGEKSLKGGPLGELVQWSDLIAALYILGHDLVISSEIKTFTSCHHCPNCHCFAQADPALKSSCPVINAQQTDFIYTDIVGLRQMKRKIPASLQNYKCRLRVLDSFGSHAEFNYQPYFTKNKEALGGRKKNAWGGQALNLQQFYNMYPHTPDNTFLGFVVETYVNISDADAQAQKPVKDNWALVYGKESYMWKGKEEYLKTVGSLAEVHATVAAQGDEIPSFVVNHGVLSGADLHRLLRKSKIFLGLGFPYEGPAPLEAIANGAVYLNPKFTPPKNRRTEKFFEEKPTLRELKSQNPYAEDFIGEPHVYTIDISNLTAVREAVRKALDTEVTPYLPVEFTAEGMLERVNAFVTHQDFCAEDTNWPPFSASHLLLGRPGTSCKDACWEQGFICERSYFPKINNGETMSRFSKCTITSSSVNSSVEEVYPPSVDSNGNCFYQSQPLLFSCASQAAGFSRLCPCRDFIKDQAALCAACL